MTKFTVYYTGGPDGREPGIYRARRQHSGNMVRVTAEGANPAPPTEGAVRFITSLFVDPAEDIVSLRQTRQRIVDNCQGEAAGSDEYAREVIAQLAELDQHGEATVEALLTARGIRIGDYVHFREAVLGGLTLHGTTVDS